MTTIFLGHENMHDKFVRFVQNSLDSTKQKAPVTFKIQASVSKPISWRFPGRA